MRLNGTQERRRRPSAVPYIPETGKSCTFLASLLTYLSSGRLPIRMNTHSDLLSGLNENHSRGYCHGFAPLFLIIGLTKKLLKSRSQTVFFSLCPTKKSAQRYTNFETTDKAGRTGIYLSEQPNSFCNAVRIFSIVFSICLSVSVFPSSCKIKLTAYDFLPAGRFLPS